MFEEHSTWHGKLKSEARKVIVEHYKNLMKPEFDDNLHSNQNGLWQEIADNVKDAIVTGDVHSVSDNVNSHALYMELLLIFL